MTYFILKKGLEGSQIPKFLTFKCYTKVFIPYKYPYLHFSNQI